MASRSIDTATLAFGLVTIPVRIYSTAQHAEEIHFHMIHAGCGERLKQQYVCPKHGVVERDDMAKGYEVAKHRMVELEPEELKALEAVSRDEIELAEFVPAEAVDPLYIDRSYYLAPGKGGERAFVLFEEALAQAELVGIARFAARGKQYVVMIRPFEDGLVMHQLRYPDEVKPAPWHDDVTISHGKVPKAELGMALQVIEQLRHDDFDPTPYHDDVKDRVRELIAQKVKSGEEIVAPEAEARPAVTDLMAALKASLAGSSSDDGHAKAPRPRRTHGAHAHRSTRSHAAEAKSHGTTHAARRTRH